MKIVLSGVETINKGAELMLYAILQEIERKYPDAEVYMPTFGIKDGLASIKTNLRLVYKPCAPFLRFAKKWHLSNLAKRFHLPNKYFNDMYPLRNADYFFDASGFRYSDQWGSMLENIYPLCRRQYKIYKQQGTKMIFLPQAFGPIVKTKTYMFVNMILNVADMVMARERISYDYLSNAGFDMSNVRIYPDFTATVQGEVPQKYEYLRNGVCIIPNARMIDKGIMSLDNYVNLINSIVLSAKRKGKLVYFLNHEGHKDEFLAKLSVSRLFDPVEVVTGLDALEVKGLISSAYMCVSSRFHGVASSLNSGVPCLATSWSHKYQELFKDFSMDDCVLPIDDINRSLEKVNYLLDEVNNMKFRKELQSGREKMLGFCSRMWEEIWSI